MLKDDTIDSYKHESFKIEISQCQYQCWNFRI